MRFVVWLACAAVAPLLMAAVQPVRLQPSSRWVVDYAENSCRLARTFGDGDHRVILNFESEVPDQVDMFVMGKPLGSDSVEVPGTFLPVQGKPMMGHTAQSADGPVVLWSHVQLLPEDLVEKLKKKAEEGRSKPGVRPPPLDLAEEAGLKAQRQAFAASATELEVGTRRSRPVILETGSLGAAFKAFDECTRTSLRDWGVDPDIENKIVRPAWSPNVLKWFSSNDYPPSMALQGQESVVKVRLLVDATGKVTKCTSLSHFKEPSFKDVVCAKFMKRAHFEPAELADGTKVPSFYTNHIIFLMGGGASY
jgi:hypothetical protein